MGLEYYEAIRQAMQCMHREGKCMGKGMSTIKHSEWSATHVKPQVLQGWQSEPDGYGGWGAHAPAAPRRASREDRQVCHEIVRRS